jgi:type I restriction enzyme, S subunit
MTGPTPVRLGDVARIQAGIGFPLRLQGRRSGRYPFAKVGDISRLVRSGRRDLTGADHWVDESDLAELRVKPLPVGAVVFAKIGEAIRQNFRAITTVPSLIDNNVIGVIANGGVLDTAYLYHFLCATDLYPLASSTTVPSIRKSLIESIVIPLPLLDEQRR